MVNIKIFITRSINWMGRNYVITGIFYVHQLRKRFFAGYLRLAMMNINMI